MQGKDQKTSHLLLELINEVLDMSKLESDEVVLEEIPFNLNSISRGNTCCDRTYSCRTEYPDHLGRERSYTLESYWKSGACETDS